MSKRNLWIAFKKVVYYWVASQFFIAAFGALYILEIIAQGYNLNASLGAIGEIFAVFAFLCVYMFFVLTPVWATSVLIFGLVLISAKFMGRFLVRKNLLVKSW
jgi:hypothetical protein